MNAPAPPLAFACAEEAEAILADLAARLATGAVAPYLGPGVAALAAPAAPVSAEGLAAFFATKVALPRRAKGNVWAAAQHIESTRHRATVTAFMAEAFAVPVASTPLHRWLAALAPPLIVDAWYDSAMRAAMSGDDWGEAQGITRAGIGEDRWYRFYDAAGLEVGREQAEGWRTAIYKPHGGIAPAKNFLITDADYVETLTEIDIQTPIPDIVKRRRTGRGFLFLGCRFDDQLLRTYARQVMKRSADIHYAVVTPEALTRNESRFLLEQNIVPLALPLARAAEILTSVPI